MRAILIVGTIVLACPALAQSSVAVDAVANITAAAPYCSFEIERDAVEQFLKERGVSRSNAADAAALEKAFDRAGKSWSVAGSVRTHGNGQADLEARCAQIIGAYGATGTIRPGLLKK
ncbi:hypothetical protein [Bosea sp. UC22_33]|uniref:hypothetical protein n=1 Tax=Bosea sp. UC22_33 TaxID=3350165 RepID=UPI00367295D3